MYFSLGYTIARAVATQDAGIGGEARNSSVGYVVSEDQKGVSVKSKWSRLSHIVGQGCEYFLFAADYTSTEHLVMQMLGDGYRHFRREKVVQIVYKLAHNDRPVGDVEAGASLTGAISSLDLVAVWSGSESHSGIQERAATCFEL